MYAGYDPLPRANPVTDRVRTDDWFGQTILSHGESYYVNFSSDVSDELSIPVDLLQSLEEGSARGFPIYVRLQYGTSVFWADPGELGEDADDSVTAVVVKKSDFHVLPPWEADSLNKRNAAASVRRAPARGLSTLILETLRTTPNLSNNEIAERLGREPAETSSMVSALYRQNEITRSKKTSDGNPGERSCYRYSIS